MNPLMMNFDATVQPVVKPERMIYRELTVGQTERKITGAFIASDWQTIISQAGDPSVEPIVPPYIKNIEDGNIPAAVRSLGVEIRLLKRSATGYQIDILEAPIAVSANIWPDEVGFDYYTDPVTGKRKLSRIVINEKWGEGRAYDADGDRIGLNIHDLPDEIVEMIKGRVEEENAKLKADEEKRRAHKQEAVGIKWPITQKPPRLKLRSDRIKENFYSLDVEDTVVRRPNGKTEVMQGLAKWWAQNPPFAYCDPAKDYMNGNLKKLLPKNIPVWQSLLDLNIPLPDKDDSLTPEGDENEDAVTVTIAVIRTADGPRAKIFVAANEGAQFIKSHKPIDVGLLTSAWNTMELEKALTWGEYRYRIDSMYRDINRYVTIELQGMKTSRKDNRSGGGQSSIDGYGKVLVPELAYFFTSSAGLKKMDLQEAIREGLINARRQLEDKVMPLKLTQADFKELPVQRARKDMRELQIVDYQLIYRLCGFTIDENGRRHTHKELRPRIKIEQFKHSSLPFNERDPFDFSCQPVIMITLVMPDGSPAALTDVKRENGQQEGLTYCFLLPPVWNVEVGRFMHPLEAMNLEFQTVVNTLTTSGRPEVVSRYDSRITRGRHGKVVGLFGMNRDPHGNIRNDFEEYPVKAARLQAAITEYCGQYGFSVGADKIGKRIVVSPQALKIVTNIITVDYCRDMNQNEMWDHIRIPNYYLRMSIAGNKQTDRRVRKYGVADPKTGVVVWANKFAHIARPGKQMAQLARAVLTTKMKVAVCLMDTKTQVFITPSGVLKQTTDKAFLPRVFSTWDKFMAHARDVVRADMDIKAMRKELADLTPAERNQIITARINEAAEEWAIRNQIRNEYFKWSTGEKQVCWIAKARAAIRVGKLLDNNGNKFMPREMNQGYIANPEVDYQQALLDTKNVAHTKDGDFVRLGEEIDLFMPIQEIIAKGAHHAMMGRNIPAHLIRDVAILDEQGVAQIIRCAVLDIEIHRSGSASENIEPRRRKATYHGTDARIIAHEVALMKANIAYNTPTKELPALPAGLEMAGFVDREARYKEIETLQALQRLLVKDFLTPEAE